jgi:transcriptional regulator with XRE-family HTH domain
MALGARLTELRLKQGQSLQQVADAVGVSKTHIWGLERGSTSNPSLDLLKKLAEHFKVSLEYLAGTHEEALVDAEAQQFFRDFKSLSDQEQALLRHTLEVFKNKKAPGDAQS